MQADPNSLYGTIVQASATIVAIVAGLVTATLLQLSADRATLRARMEELDHELSTLRKQSAEAELEPHRVRTDWLFASPSFDVVQLARSGASAGEVRDRLHAEDVDMAVFTEAWQLLVSEVNEAFETIETAVETFGAREDKDFDAWVKDHSIQLGITDEWVAQFAFWQICERLYPPKPKPKGWLIDPQIRNFPIESMVSESERQIRTLNRNRQEEQLEALRGVASELARRVETAEANRELLRKRIQDFRYPPHLRKGFAILGIFSVTGILVPLALMPQPAEMFTVLHRVGVLGGFVLGLVLVGGYMVSVFREISRGV